MFKEVKYVIVRKKDNKVYMGTWHFGKRHKKINEYSDNVFEGMQFNNRKIAALQAARLRNWLGRPKLEILQIEIRKSK